MLSSQLALLFIAILLLCQQARVLGFRVAAGEDDELENELDSLKLDISGTKNAVDSTKPDLEQDTISVTEAEKNSSAIVLERDEISEAKDDVTASDDPSHGSTSSTHRHLLPSWMTMKYLTSALVKANLRSMVTKKLQEEKQAQEELDRIKSDDCHGMILKSVGKPIVHSTYGSHSQGVWMKDPLQYLGAGKIWAMSGYTGQSVVKEFASYKDFKVSIVSKSHKLPYTWDGTGAVVYGPYLYFNRAGTNHIIKYDLRSDQVVKARSYGLYNKVRSYRYSWGGYSGMDLAVDESGIWVLAGYSRYGGRLSAAMINPDNLAYYNYWNAQGKTQNTMGNAFVACGVVYMVDHYAGNTKISYAYDTKTHKAMTVNIPFKWQFGYGSSLDYNPTEKLLYAWDYYHQVTYSLEFTKKA